MNEDRQWEEESDLVDRFGKNVSKHTKKFDGKTSAKKLQAIQAEERLQQEYFERMKNIPRNIVEILRANASADPDCSKFRELGWFNFENQNNLYRLGTHMAKHAQLLEMALRNSGKRRKVYGSKAEMAREIYHLTLGYLRGFRAYHFTLDLTRKKTQEKL